MVVWVSLAHLPHQVLENVFNVPIPLCGSLVKGEVPLPGEFLNLGARYFPLVVLRAIQLLVVSYKVNETRTRSSLVPTMTMGMS